MLPNFDLEPLDIESEVLVPNLSPYQYFAFRFLADGNSLDQLSQFEGFKYNKTIITCIKRLAFGLEWTPHEAKGGRKPFLCPYDENKFVEQLSSEIDSGNSQPTAQILQRIQDIHEKRFNIAMNAFAIMNRWDLKLKYEDKGYSYVGYKYLYEFIDRHKYKYRFELIHMDEIEALRIANGCPMILRPWYQSFIELKKGYRDICVFGADEMGIELSSRKLNFLTKRTNRISVAADPQFPHTTVMFAHSMGGYALPPFVIMQGNTETNDMRELLKINNLFIATNASGWMTEAMFALWCMYFSCQLSQYKLHNDINFNEKVLLILDGHSSRACVLGLEILKLSNVDVLTLVSHTSHVSQMFDVQLAAPLKAKFSSYYKSYLAKFEKKEISNIQKQRLAMLCAIQDSWSEVANPHNCKKSGKKAGYKVHNDADIEKFFNDKKNRVASDLLASAFRADASTRRQKKKGRSSFSGNYLQASSSTSEIHALQTTDVDSVIPENYQYDFDRNEQSSEIQQEINEIREDTIDTFSRLTINGKILTSSEMINHIRAFKESRHGDTCLHIKFPVELIYQVEIEVWICDFFNVLHLNGTHLLSSLPSLLIDYTKFRSINNIVIFPRHINFLTPEAIVDINHLRLPHSLSVFPCTSTRYFSKKIKFIQKKTNIPMEFAFPPIPEIFHIEPNSISDYRKRLIEGINLLDCELCLCLLRLINKFFPYSDSRFKSKDVSNICVVSNDYPNTSALVKELPYFGVVIEQHKEIFQLITMDPRIPRKKQNLKEELIKASKFIHYSIISLMETEENGNLEDLRKIDTMFVEHLSSDKQMNQDECEIILQKSKNKIDKFNPEQKFLFSRLSSQSKVAVLELNKNDRIKALYQPDHYYPYFNRLNKTQRVIFLGKCKQEAFQAFQKFSENEWRDINLLNLPDLKAYIKSKLQEFATNQPILKTSNSINIANPLHSEINADIRSHSERSVAFQKPTFENVYSNPSILDELNPENYPKLSIKQVRLLLGKVHLAPWQIALLNESMVKIMKFEEIIQLKEEQSYLIEQEQLVNLNRQQVRSCPSHIIPLLPYPIYLNVSKEQIQYLTEEQKGNIQQREILHNTTFTQMIDVRHVMAEAEEHSQNNYNINPIEDQDPDFFNSPPDSPIIDSDPPPLPTNVISTESQQNSSFLLPYNLIQTHYPEESISPPQKKISSKFIRAPFPLNNNLQEIHNNEETNVSDSSSDDESEQDIDDDNPHFEPTQDPNGGNLQDELEHELDLASPQQDYIVPIFEENTNPIEFLSIAYNYLKFISSHSEKYSFQRELYIQWKNAYDQIPNENDIMDFYYNPFESFISRGSLVEITYDEEFENFRYFSSKIFLPFEFSSASKGLSQFPSKYTQDETWEEIPLGSQAFLIHNQPYIIIPNENDCNIFTVKDQTIIKIFNIKNIPILKLIVDEEKELIYFLTPVEILNYSIRTKEKLNPLNFQDYIKEDEDVTEFLLAAYNGVLILSTHEQLLIYKQFQSTIDNLSEFNQILPLKIIQQSDNIVFDILLGWNGNIFSYTENNFYIEEYSTNGHLLSLYPAMPFLEKVYSLKHLDYLYICTIHSFNENYIMNFINMMNYTITLQLCHNNKIKKVKYYNHGKITLIFILDEVNQLICYELENGILINAVQHHQQIIDFTFDFIEGKLKLLFSHGLCTISWPFPIMENDLILKEES